MAQTKTRVVMYVRVSTSEQAVNGVSLDAQAIKLGAYATALDLTVVDTVTEVASAKSLARPGLQRALTMLESGEADALAVTCLDRLTRSVADLGTLIERYFAKRFSLLSVGDSVDTRSAAGRLVLHILGSVSQWEREAIGERTKTALAHLRDTGVRLGATPMGLRYGARDASGRCAVEVDPTEVNVIARIAELRASGLSYAKCAHVLRTERVPTKRGGTWDARRVRLISVREARTIPCS